MQYMILIFVASWHQKFREKFKKSTEKFVPTTSYRYLRDLKKITLQLFGAENVHVHLYKKFFRTSLYDS